MRTTRDKFLRYIDIIKEGKYNIYTDAINIIQATGMTIDDYMEIQRNFDYYSNLYLDDNGNVKPWIE